MPGPGFVAGEPIDLELAVRAAVFLGSCMPDDGVPRMLAGIYERHRDRVWRAAVDAAITRPWIRASRRPLSEKVVVIDGTKMVCRRGWATQEHAICLIAEVGTTTGERVFAHTGAGIAEMCAWLLQRGMVVSSDANSPACESA